MRKKIISLALALLLCLCLGLAVPAMAVDTSGLNANGAKAFYDTLSAYGDAVIHADLLDMNGDKSPELVVVSSPWPDGNGFNYNVATVDIWQLKSGQAAKTASVECDAGTFVGMNYISVDGEICLCASASSGRPGFHGIWETFVFAERWEFLSACWYDEPAGESENIADEINGVDFSRATNGGSGGAISREEYKAYIQKYRSASSVGDGFLSAGGQSWYLGEENAPSYQDVLTLLLAKLTSATPAPAAGTYGPYTITGFAYLDPQYPYTLTFDAAKVEQKTVQVRGEDPDSGYSSYGNRTVIVVTLRPDTVITVTGGDPYNPGVPVFGGHYDGDNKYTVGMQGAWDMIYGGVVSDVMSDAMLYSTFYYMNLPLDQGEPDYYFQIDTNVPAAGGFIDVKSGSYYEEAVKWAVENGVTAGTSANKFSPEQTCTVGQILTFLWRANGSPKQTGGNPFSDVSSSDYYYDAALWAHGKGLVSGGQLNPGAACTRAMTVTYLWKLAGSPNSNRVEYSAQTITGVEYGEPCSVEFSAATIEDTTISKSTYTGAQEREAVTLITVAPGSTMTIHGVPSDLLDVPAVFLLDYYKEDGMYYDSGPRGYTEIPSVTFSNSEYGIKDGIQYLNLDATAWEMSWTSESGNPYLIEMGSEAASFTDVPSTSDYAQAVAWAVENEITGGTGNGQFSPNSTCTRGQIVTFLYRAMGQ